MRCSLAMLAASLAFSMLGCSVGCRGALPQSGKEPSTLAAPDASQPDLLDDLAALGVADAPLAQAGEQGSQSSLPHAAEVPTAIVPAEDPMQLFWASVEDPPSDFLDGVREEYYGRHYVVGDEWNAHLFAPYLEGLGGGYVGVGTDQAYLFMDWQRADWAWLIDYDPYAVMVHRIYALVFAVADTPEQFRAYFDDELRLDDCRKLLAEHFQGEQLELAKKVLSSSKGRITTRLWKLRRKLDELDIDAWINNQSHYDWVRAMVLERRVRPMLGNLLERSALLGLAEAAAKMKVPVRVLYLSNAEEYWNYQDSFRENIDALPFDEQSVVLRTVSSHASNHDYRYFVQPAGRFVEFLARSEIGNVSHVIRRRHIKHEDDIPIVLLDWTPQEAIEKRRKKVK